MAEEVTTKEAESQESSTAATQAEPTGVMKVKVLPVICQEEIFRYIDLGLGRGLDGTDQTPWLNKTSFQARNVTYDNILRTEEGGALQSYEREIVSVQTLQSKIKASIVIPKSPMTIGADAELSRSVNSSRRAIGRQIINRTVSFKDDFVDAPCSDETILEKIGGSSDVQNHWTFEQRLAHWIIQKLKASWQKSVSVNPTASIEEVAPLTLLTEVMTGKCPLADLLFVIEQHRKPDLQLIIKGCEEFLDYFRVTHYVNAIELGAAEYRVLTEDEYQKFFSSGGSFGIEKLASLVTQQGFLRKKKITASELKKIGVFTSDDKVERGSYSEAVVNVAIKSILTLVKTDFLHKAMSTALLKFIDSQSDKSNGSFLISCGIASRLFLAVDPKNRAVEVTNELAKATHFQIIPSDDKYNEFYIAYREEKARVLQKHCKSVFCDPGSTVAMYLNAPAKVRGQNNGPLYMLDTVSDESSRFVLHSCIKRNKVSPVLISTWTNGTEMFYISCSRRKFKKNGYLAVKLVPKKNEADEDKADKDEAKKDIYITACMSDTKYHDSSNVHMLFQLIPTYLIEDEEGREDKNKPQPLEQSESEF